MSFAEKIIKEQVTSTPDRYRRRVGWSALIYLVLNLVSIVILILIVWWGKFFVTLAQRSNVETATLAIIMVLALYYIFSTFRGAVGAVRIMLLRPASGERKQAAVKQSNGESKFAMFDKMVRIEDAPAELIDLEIGDDAGTLGHIEIGGAKATYRPIKDGMKDSIFEFLSDQIENVLKRRDPDASLNITEWSTIDDDQASAYNSMVTAFENLERAIKSEKPLWPTYELTREEIAEVQAKLRELTPCLREESFLPDVEYEVEYNVPIIPEPLGFIKLSRRDNRADPAFTMGCAGIIMLGIMLLLALLILLPPWLPSS